MSIPTELRYSSDHEWIAVDGNRARIGHHRLRAGRARRCGLRAGARRVGAHGRRPATASARSRAPSRSATSTRRCRAPSSPSTRRWPTQPDALNTDPYGAGWICEIEMSDPADIDGLLDAVGYQALIDGLVSSRMAYVFCNQCGHRNPPDSGFCSSCGSVLDRIADHTITLAKVDPLQDAPGTERRRGGQRRRPRRRGGVADRAQRCAGRRQRSRCAITLTRLGRHPDSEIMPRRHHRVAPPRRGRARPTTATSSATPVAQRHLPQRRADRRRAVLHQGDELQVGKFRLVFFERR